MTNSICSQTHNAFMISYAQSDVTDESLCMAAEVYGILRAAGVKIKYAKAIAVKQLVEK